MTVAVPASHSRLFLLKCFSAAVGSVLVGLACCPCWQQARKPLITSIYADEKENTNKARNRGRGIMHSDRDLALAASDQDEGPWVEDEEADAPDAPPAAALAVRG